MGRQGQGRKSLNSSIVTVTNNSLLEDADKQAIELEYAEFVKRFGRPDLDEESKIDLIGYEDTIKLLKDKIESLLEASSEQDFALITGPSGTGKTTVVRKLAEQYSKQKLSFFYLKSSWTLERQFGNPETRLRSLFDEAIQKAPSLIFIDKVDLICSEKRSQNDTKDRVFNILEDKLESLNLGQARVLVLAATDKPEVLDPQMRKPCYFSDEIRFTLPKRQDRVQYLEYVTYKHKSSLTLEEIEQIADASHCYSYRDLSKLCNIASKYVKVCRNNNDELIDYPAMRFALSQFKPVAIKSITTPCPPLKWEDIGGVEAVKRELQESVIWPLEHRSKFQRLGICSNKGAILYGPPGCSKTMLAQALATESGYNFISIKGPELFSKWVGDSEAAVRKLYRNAREIAPCIIFFDEIDGFAPERSDNQSSSVGDKVVAQLLTELNGIEPLDNVFTIAATNRPDRVDSALLRPGRLDPAIYIPLPSESDRREIFKVHMRPLSLKFDESLDGVVDSLAAQTTGYSGAEIANVCRVAGTLALRESLENESIELKHFMAALDKVKPRTRNEQLEAYKKFQERSPRGLEKQGTSMLPQQSASEKSSYSGSMSDFNSMANGGTARNTNANDIKRDSQPATESVLSTKVKKRTTIQRLMRSLSLKRPSSGQKEEIY